MNPSHLLLYAITDRSWLQPTETLAGQVELLLQAGVTCVQLREKQLDGVSLLREALALKALCARYHVPFLINDNVSLCREIDADGVHVGQADLSVPQARRILGPGKLIGASAHNPAEALRAQADGADYIGCGAVFGSSTKGDASYLGVEGLRAIRAATDLPMVAIGGIGPDNLPQLAGTGINGVAVISALFAPADKPAATARLLELAREAVSP